MLRFALPEYRLPKPVLRREIELIERLGVKFVFNTRVGVDISLNELDEQFDAVCLAIGTWKESWVYLPGTELKGVFPALPFLESVAKGESVNLGRKVVVIGGGNAAIDSARTALRMGAEVTVVYRRERKDMPAIEEETAAAEEEGARIVFLAAPHRIIGDAKGNVKALEVVKTRLGEYDRSGRRKPVLTDEVQRFECDSVILAVGETVDLDFAKASGLQIKEGGTIEVDHFTLETSRPRFFAGGDLVTGASNVSNAMAYGKQAARAIDEQLMDAKRWDELFPADGIRPDAAQGAERKPPPSFARSCRCASAPQSSTRSVRRLVGGRDARGMLPLPALRREGSGVALEREESTLPQKKISLRIDGELVNAARGPDHPRSRARQRKVHSDSVLPGRPEFGGRLPAVHGGGLRRRPPVPRLHHAGAGRHVGDHHFAPAVALPPHDHRTAAGGAQPCLRGLRGQRSLRIAGHGVLPGHHQRALRLQLSRGCRWTYRIPASCSTTTAASCARAACAPAPRSRARTCGRWWRAASTPASFLTSTRNGATPAPAPTAASACRLVRPARWPKKARRWRRWSRSHDFDQFAGPHRRGVHV